MLSRLHLVVDTTAETLDTVHPNWLEGEKEREEYDIKEEMDRWAAYCASNDPGLFQVNRGECLCNCKETYERLTDAGQRVVHDQYADDEFADYYAWMRRQNYLANKQTKEQWNCYCGHFADFMLPEHFK